MADFQPFAGLRGGSPALSERPPRPPYGAQNENRFLILRNMQGDARRCAVKSPMCDDEPTRSIGFGITLWPTAFLCSTTVEDFSTKLRRNRDFAAILCSGDGDGR